MKATISFLVDTVCMLFAGQAMSQKQTYPDGRPAANFKIDCIDEGVVFHHGNGKHSCDVYGAREAVLNKVGNTYNLFYDGAAKDG